MSNSQQYVGCLPCGLSSLPGQTQPTYQQPVQPTYQQTQPTYQQPIYQQPMQPTYQQTQPTYQQPIYQQTQPIYQQPTYQQPMQPTYPVYQETGPTLSQQQDVINSHNTWRSTTNPPASNMKPITWSDDLAQSAASWANKCDWRHSQTPGVGENLYASSRRTPNPSTYDYSQAIDSWGNEVKDYDYVNNSCAPGKTCGHYTQVVWADSDKVGCAVKDCDSIKGLNWPDGGTVTVCQYNPPGNYIGQRPYNA